MVAKLPLFYSRNLDGHRREYLKFTIGLFGGDRTNILRMFFSSRPVLFLMIEDSFALYCAVSIWRSFWGWRTVGLLFRPKPAVEGKSFRLRIKRRLLRILRCFRAIQTFSIVPIELDPRFSEIVDDWIYDFQLWDISEADRKCFEILRKDPAEGVSYAKDAADMVLAVRNAAKGRQIISAIGRQDRFKGFDQFALLAKRDDFRMNWHPVVGGKVDCCCEDNASIISTVGGTVTNRFVSDEEVIALYAASDVIWCSYAECYDQASGIFGRAIQFGLPVVVRDGSLSHRLCVVEFLPHIPFVDYKNLVGMLSNLPKMNAQQGKILAENFRKLSLEKLKVALGVNAHWDMA